MAGEPTVWLGDVLHEHADQAAYFRASRAHVKGSRTRTLADLDRLDERIDAHLDGLRLFADAEPDAALAIARAHGGAFVQAAIALHLGRHAVVRDISSEAGGRHAALSAAGWAGAAPAEAAVPALAAGPVEALRVAVDITRVYRRDPHGVLPGALDSDDARVRAAALRAVVASGRSDLAPRAARALDDGDAECRAWAACVAARSGGPETHTPLARACEAPGPAGDAALALAVRLLPAADAQAVIQRIAASGGARRAIEAAAAWGDPAAFPFLLSQLEVAEHARLAAWAIAFVAGLSGETTRLAAPPPPGFQSGPSDSQFERDVGLDPDARLPWPDPQKYRDAIAERPLPAGVRHARGRPIDRAGSLAALANDVLAARAYAAWDLACEAPDRPLFDVRAPAARQVRWLRDPSPFLRSGPGGPDARKEAAGVAAR